MYVTDCTKNSYSIVRPRQRVEERPLGCGTGHGYVREWLTSLFFCRGKRLFLFLCFAIRTAAKTFVTGYAVVPHNIIQFLHFWFSLRHRTTRASCPNLAGVELCAPSRKGCVPNGQMTKESMKWGRLSLPPPHLPIAWVICGSCLAFNPDKILLALFFCPRRFASESIPGAGKHAYTAQQSRL